MNAINSESREKKFKAEQFNDSKLFSTQHIHHFEKLDYWQYIIEKNVISLDFKARKENIFEASISTTEIDSLKLSLISSTPHTVKRGSNSGIFDSSNTFIFNIVLAGTLIASQDGTESIIKSGEGVFVNSEREYKLNLTSNSKLAVIRVPRDLLAKATPGIDRVTAYNLASSNPIFPIVSAYIKPIYERSKSLPLSSSPRVASNLIDLLSTMIFEILGKKTGDIPEHKLINLLKMKNFVEGNLSNPELNPTTIASFLGISTRYINQLLVNEKTSLNRYIWQQRMKKAARDLRDPSKSVHNISTIAFNSGFNNMAHFSKTFRKRYGISPSEYRKNDYPVV